MPFVAEQHRDTIGQTMSSELPNNAWPLFLPIQIQSLRIQSQSSTCIVKSRLVDTALGPTIIGSKQEVQRFELFFNDWFNSKQKMTSYH